MKQLDLPFRRCALPGALLAVAALAAAASAATPTYYHQLCDPRAPLDARAADCTTLHVTIVDTGWSAEDQSKIPVDGIWARLNGTCEIPLNNGLVDRAPGDSSERIFEFTGQTMLPVDVAWSFPSGCGVVAHVRELSQTDRFFRIAPEVLDEADVNLIFNLEDGSMTEK